MIVFDSEEVISLFGFNDITGRLLLRMEGIGGHDGPFQRQRFEQFGEFGDFIGLVVDRDLADDHGFLMEDGAEQVGWRLSRLMTAAHGFAINGHSVSG